MRLRACRILVVAAAAWPLAPAAGFLVACSFSEDVDYEGGDLRSVAAQTKEDCCRTCVAEPTCAAGVLFGARCYLKDASARPAAGMAGRVTCVPPAVVVKVAPGMVIPQPKTLAVPAAVPAAAPPSPAQLALTSTPPARAFPQPPGACRVEVGFDYDDGFVQATKVDSVRECADACLALANCTHFSWVGDASGAGSAEYRSCYAKAGVPEHRRAAAGVHAGRCRGDPELARPAAEATTTPSRSLAPPPASLQGPHSGSFARPQPPDSFSLKQTTSPAPAKVSPQPSAPSARHDPCTIEHNTIYGGGRIKQLYRVRSYRACSRECVAAAGCTHFSWIGRLTAGGMEYNTCTLNAGAPRLKRSARDVISGVCRDAPRSAVPSSSVLAPLSSSIPTLQLVLITCAAFTASLALLCLTISCCCAEQNPRHIESKSSMEMWHFPSIDYLRDFNLIYDDGKAGWGH